MNRTQHSRALRVATAVFAVLIIGVTALGQLADTPWPTMNRDLQRTGRSPYIGPDEPIKKWRFEMEEGSVSGIAIAADGTIYVGDRSGLFYAVNPDGTEKWRFQTQGTSIFSAGPTIAADGTIYIGTSHGISDNGLHALNPDGTERWFFPPGGEVHGSVALDEDGTIYLGTGDAIIYAIDPDGRQVWQFGSAPETYYFAASPAIGHDGRLYTPTYLFATDLYCLDRDGREVWRAPGHNSWGGACIGATGVIYTADGGFGALIATNPDGTLRWFVDIGLSVGLPCIGTDGTVYAPGFNGLHAVSPDGIVQWVQPASFVARPVVDGQGTVYVGSDGNSVYAYRPDGELRWIFDADGNVSRAQFAIDVDGTIYFAADAPFDGFLYAIGPGPNLPCPADFDNDGNVGASDLLALLAAWGACPNKADCPEDLDGDGNVGASDLLALLANWGPCP